MDDNKYLNRQLEEMIGRCLKEKFVFIPDTKLVITSNLLSWKENEEISRETLYVCCSELGQRGIPVSSMLELLKKRWETLDLISVMMELQRTVTIKLTSQNKLVAGGINYRLLDAAVKVQENLSCLPRLQKTEEV